MGSAAQITWNHDSASSSSWLHVSIGTAHIVWVNAFGAGRAQPRRPEALVRNKVTLVRKRVKVTPLAPIQTCKDRLHPFAWLARCGLCGLKSDDTMQDDPELRRLKEIQRLTRERFLRLSLPGSFGGVPKSSRPRKRFGGKRLPLFVHTGTSRLSVNWQAALTGAIPARYRYCRRSTCHAGCRICCSACRSIP